MSRDALITVDQAILAVQQHAQPLPPTRIPVAQALGLTLAEDITADVDSPPHDKAMVDGYAVVAADLAKGPTELEILEEVTAGDVPTQNVSAGKTTRIMTGAPLPSGADAVVMVEQTQTLSNNKHANNVVRIDSHPIASGDNIMPRGTSMRRGQAVVASGSSIRPIEVGVLSEVGRTKVLACPRPTLAVLATGNELVPTAKLPAAGQIRNSNGPMLLIAAERAGATTTDLGIASDDRQTLARLIAQGLESDILVLSGGVSAGVLDLVPAVLQELGVEQIFHKVRLKPGKPLWFGRRDLPTHRTLVFGLPGNPVSALVCFELFTRRAIALMSGKNDAAEGLCKASLSKPHDHRGDRPTFHPSRMVDAHTVEPLPWRGSADLSALTAADVLVCFPAGNRSYNVGEMVDVRPL